MSNVIVTVTGDTAHVETQAVAYHASDDRDTVIVPGCATPTTAFEGITAG